jgi:tetratricopeptide (TPR) repeat protein
LQQLSSQLDPQTVISDNRFLNAYAAIGDYQSVINILTTRLGQDPKNAQYKLSLASAYATIGQKQKAISLINEIIADNPSFKDQGEQYIKQLQ